MNFNDIKSIFTHCSFVLDDEKIATFDKYLDLVCEVNKQFNLTAIKTKQEMIEKHIYDCLLACKNTDLSGNSIIDIGSGAGFPGIVFAIAFPQAKLTLVEPTNKRANFLKTVKTQLNLHNVEVVAKRAEDLKEFRGKYDFATARAVASLSILLELTVPLLKIDGVLIALKGPKAEEEVKNASNAMKVLNVKLINITTDFYRDESSVRNNIFIRKLKSTSVKYPRRYDKIKSNPL